MRRRMSAKPCASEEEQRLVPIYKGKRIGDDSLVLCFQGVSAALYTMAKTRLKTIRVCA